VSWAALLGAGLAALAAGPWLELGLAVFVPRAFLAAVALWLLRKHRPLAAGSLLLLAVFWGVEALARRRASPEALEAALQRGVQRLSGELSLLAQAPPLPQLLAGTGAEAEPEAPFLLLRQHQRRLPEGVEGLAVVDLRGEPVAWVGQRPRLPLRWRPVGERACLPERWVGEVVLFCREPVYESGRVVGAVLASVAFPEGGCRSVLGVSAGVAAQLVPVLGENQATRPTLELVSRPATPAWWARSGLACALAPLLLLLWVPAPLRAWLALLAAGLGVGVGVLPAALVPALALFALALLARLLADRLWRFLWAGVVGGVAWALPPLLVELGVPPLPESLLRPPLPLLAALFGFVVLAVASPASPRHLPWLALLPLSVGVSTASGSWLAVGAGVLVATLGEKRRVSWVAGCAAAVFVGGGDGAAKSAVLAKTEATLARWGRVESVARALLASLPEGRLAALAAAPAGQRVVRLGELGEFLQLSQVLPGTALVLEDQGGQPLATWGEVGLLAGGREEELAVRALPEGWRLRLLAAPRPHNVLAALAASGVGVPVAAYDRAGAPVARGAPFAPLPPALVGEALARERGWGRVVVGQRPVPTYLRGFEDWVLAVPWLRPAWPDLLLLLGALFLWGAGPFFLWEQGRQLRRFWAFRSSFAGRLRGLVFTATVLPLVLLGNVLPAQWAREREQARAELARFVSSAVTQSFWQESLTNLVRDVGAVVAVYRPSLLVVTSRPDLAVLGGVPEVPPAEAYVRAVRRWFEPVVASEQKLAVYVPARSGDQALVFAVLGVEAFAGSRFRPAEWFVIAGLGAVLLALWAAELLARRLATPMALLVRAARQLGRGEPADLSPVQQGEDEFATLAHAFQTMAGQIQARQEELVRQRDLLQRVLENLSAAVVVLEESRVVLANAAASALGVGEEAAFFEELFGPRLGELLAKAREGARVAARLSPPGKAEALWNVTAVPLSGEAPRVLLVLEDLSEVARAERLASLTELARIVAHEVKNPLTPIRLWMEELQAALAKGPEQVVEVAKLAVEETLQQVARLREVSQGFSNLVALERWQPERVDAVALARAVVEEYRVLDRRGVRVVLRHPETPLPVLADPSWLARALRHLLDNSAKALAGKGGRITVEGRQQGEWVVLAVRDTGGGVDEAHLPRLFEPHFSTTSEGSGLGLAVVNRVCQKAGGRAEARNLPEGLEVRMLLPLAP
jgi:signal transduction histidine kinase/HAMP domain-containing protein